MRVLSVLFAALALFGSVAASSDNDVNRETDLTTMANRRCVRGRMNIGGRNVRCGDQPFQWPCYNGCNTCQQGMCNERGILTNCDDRMCITLATCTRPGDARQYTTGDIIADDNQSCICSSYGSFVCTNPEAVCMGKCFAGQIWDSNKCTCITPTPTATPTVCAPRNCGINPNFIWDTKTCACVQKPSTAAPTTTPTTTTAAPETGPIQLCPNGASFSLCKTHPCAAVLCPFGTTCVPNICNNFPTQNRTACTASCVSQSLPSPTITNNNNVCELRAGQSTSVSLVCGANTAFPTCTDGCNTCTCNNGVKTCTERMCITLATCTGIDGTRYTTGDIFPKKVVNFEGAYVNDNKNVCICGPYGRTTCSQLA